jgi:hypothetical protein
MQKTLFTVFALFIYSIAQHGYAQTQTVGLFNRTSASEDGYVLFAPMTSDNTYLIDKCGKNVHTWNSTRKPGAAAYFLEDGSLLRTEGTSNTNFSVGGTGGAIVRYDWNSNVLWSYTISSDRECQHHDICRLPNGNILAIVWDRQSAQNAIDAGRDPSHVGTDLWSEKIVELQPSGTNSATIVWEWRVWEHLVQEFDASKPGFGSPADNPGLIDINFSGDAAPGVTDWLHINAVDYNPKLDQIMVSVHSFSEIWVIDHSTTMLEASGHSGGHSGQGGDLLYRWGNPAAYGHGSGIDQQLYGQHNARWIKAPRSDSGKIMIFNNGLSRPGSYYSTVDIINPPYYAGGYQYTVGVPYGPTAPSWQYKAPSSSKFYSAFMSGAQPLSSGNTLICEGDAGRFFEVDESGNVVWQYVNPIAITALSQGAKGNGLNNAFRCTQYPASYPGFKGKTLTAGAPLEQNPLNYTCKMGSTGGGGGGTPNGIASLIDEQRIVAVNPISDELILQSDQSINTVSLSLTEITGKVCQQWNNVHFSGNAPLRLSISPSLTRGMYLLQVTTKDHKQVIKLTY